MAAHPVEKLSYRFRYEQWKRGRCPYCGSEDVGGDFDMAGYASTCERYTCNSCGAANKFTNPNVIGAKKK